MEVSGSRTKNRQKNFHSCAAFWDKFTTIFCPGGFVGEVSWVFESCLGITQAYVGISTNSTVDTSGLFSIELVKP